jgi:hypothetical protein
LDLGFCLKGKFVRKDFSQYKKCRISYDILRQFARKFLLVVDKLLIHLANEWNADFPPGTDCCVRFAVLTDSLVVSCNKNIS